MLPCTTIPTHGCGQMRVSQGVPARAPIMRMSSQKLRQPNAGRNRLSSILVVGAGGNFRPYRPGPKGPRGRRPNQPNSNRKNPINEEIRVPEVRLLDKDKSMLGVVKRNEALLQAKAQGVDLVLISSTADPPLCRLVDYSKFKYEQEKEQREARKKQRAARIDTKELKMRPATDVHDYQVRLRKAVAEIAKGNHIKAVVTFRGREMAFKDQGKDLLNRFIGDLGETVVVERGMRMEGRNMSVIVKPNK
ncbi:hypothetical protein BSKO_01385 [Bryopsis sp. KO-2023]|nr:hypothetical protein BSKO_01385 [Bryopsis sp. KO-2023]